ncbi:MAG: serine/threonine kinase [Candidatus Ruthia sp. Asou_11_S2]|nr:serine/threonine kinase [Candidatus Ruthia sp. Asou_11_S2]
MRNTFILVLTSILVLAQGSAIARDDYDLFWDGESEKNKKYLFFAPLASGKIPMYSEKIIRNNFSENMNEIVGQESFSGTEFVGEKARGYSPDERQTINMIKIFGGCIVNEDLPESVLSANEECVDDFYISDGEVTNAQYNKFLLSMGKSDEAITENAQNPIVNVSRQEAVDFAEWMSKEHQKHYMLPKTIYAANANALSVKKNICSQANVYYCNNQSESIMPVKSLSPNSWELYGMLGNVWEWVIDESTQEKVAKGGSWKSISAKFVGLNYQYIPKSEKSDEVGFRIVMID